MKFLYIKNIAQFLQTLQLTIKNLIPTMYEKKPR
jgi:hypothetical protein